MEIIIPAITFTIPLPSAEGFIIWLMIGAAWLTIQVIASLFYYGQRRVVLVSSDWGYDTISGSAEYRRVMDGYIRSLVICMFTFFVWPISLIAVTYDVIKSK